MVSILGSMISSYRLNLMHRIEAVWFNLRDQDNFLGLQRFSAFAALRPQFSQ